MILFPTRQIAISLGPVSVHWYGVMYAIAFVSGMYIFKRLQKHRGLSLSEKQLEAFLLLIFLGVVVGGRLGYVFFYGGDEYWSHPFEIFALWHGGMSSHGGFLGVLLALIYFTRKYRISILRITDVLVVPVALGLAWGRLGNFINAELYGNVSRLPWAIEIPNVEGLRHPTQLYALFKDVCLAFISFALLKRSPSLPSGFVTACFLILYAVLRFTVEIFRDQPFGFIHVGFMEISRGQLLTVPILGAGVITFIISARANEVHR